jgi:hypothetical protein
MFVHATLNNPAVWRPMSGSVSPTTKTLDVRDLNIDISLSFKPACDWLRFGGIAGRLKNIARRAIKTADGYFYFVPVHDYVSINVLSIYYSPEWYNRSPS